jgi:hypothetical protein
MSEVCEGELVIKRLRREFPNVKTIPATLSPFVPLLQEALMIKRAGGTREHGDAMFSLACGSDLCFF